MTNQPIAPQVFSRPIPKAGDFAPLDRKPDTSKNRRRGARKTQKRRFIL